MIVRGLQKLTLLDYPGRTACTVFTGGCNFRCPFCHNASLVLRQMSYPAIPEEDVFDFLRKRRGTLDGVCVTGGEPLLQPGLRDFICRVKDMGFLVKLDTNGSSPEKLRELMEDRLLDMVAMDVKNSPEKYAETCGLPTVDLSAIQDSIDLLTQGEIPYEFRTTAVKELHTEEDFRAIGQWLSGAEAYFLQSFQDSGDVIGKNYHPWNGDVLRRFLSILQETIHNAQLRGVD